MVHDAGTYEGILTYHIDLPPPVAMTTKQSRSLLTASTTSRWYGRRDENQNTSANDKYVHIRNVNVLLKIIE